MMLFGEKYPEVVRVVSMGKQAREQGTNALGWSVELCGGTHVRRTGDIGLITVTGEGSVASGVRRIEALTGNHARRHANDTMALARTAAGELRTTLDDGTEVVVAIHSGMVGELTRAQGRQADGSWSDLGKM